MTLKGREVLGAEFSSVKRRYVKASVLATLCGVKKITIHKWLREGKIPKPAVMGVSRPPRPHAWTEEQANEIVAWYKGKRA